MAVANQYSEEDYGNSSTGATAGASYPAQPATAVISEKLRKKDPTARGSSSGGGTTDSDREHFAWVGQLQPEPQFLASSDEPSPGSTGRTGSGSIGRPRPSEDRNPWGFGYDSYTGGAGDVGIDRSKSDATRSTRSGASAEALLDGREPNFFSVVLGPRRALRVVNGMGD
jgi:hypothetical protein